MKRMITASQRIWFGDLDEAVTDFVSPEENASVLVVGTQRSVGLRDWPRLWPSSAVHVYGGARPHNPLSVVGEARQSAAAGDVTHVVAVGGSSSIDLGKAVVDEGRRARKLVAVPTTLGGSEMSRVYGMLEPEGHKGGGAGSRLLPSLVCYDPQLLSSMPLDVLGGTGINAWAHAIEAYYSRTEHWLGRSAAADAGGTLAIDLYEARQGVATETIGGLTQGAHLAGFALNACGMGLHHALCHVMGGVTGLAHGRINAVALPHSLRLQEVAAPDVLHATSEAFALREPLSEVADRLRVAYGFPETLDVSLEDEHKVAAIVTEILHAPHLSNSPSVTSRRDMHGLVARLAA